ncbi:MAG TPA: hypothetical protein VGN07_03935 [Steroidobacteraceae bacterium]|jgi:hypothetical protein
MKHFYAQPEQSFASTAFVKSERITAAASVARLIDATIACLRTATSAQVALSAECRMAVNNVGFVGA